MKVCIPLLFTFFIPMTPFAVTPDAMSEFETYCKGTKSNIDRNELQALFDNGLFPGTYDSVGSFVSKIESLKNAKPADLCSPFLVKPKNLQAPFLLKDILKSATASVSQVFENQNKMIEIGQTCSKELSHFTKKNRIDFSKWSKSDTQEFSKQSKSPVLCAGFVESFIPELKMRFHEMRQYLAIAKNKLQINQKIPHDKSFGIDFMSSFISTTWKKNSASELAPIPNEQKEELTKKSQIYSSEDALKKYDLYLSSAPILTFFSDEPNPESIQMAFTQLGQKSKIDIAEFKKNPSQDITLLLPHIIAAIEKLPLEKKGDACQLIRGIHQNLVTRYETVPMLAGLYSMLLGGPLISSAKTALGKIMTSTALFSSSQSPENFQRYSAYSKMCANLMMSKSVNQSSKETSLCSFRAADEIASDIKSGIVMGGGAVLFGNLNLGIKKMVPLAAPLVVRGDDSTE